MGFDSKCNFAPLTILLGLLPWTGGIPHSRSSATQPPRHQIANIRWIIEKAREFQENIYLCFIDDAKAFVWITMKIQLI